MNGSTTSTAPTTTTTTSAMAKGSGRDPKKTVTFKDLIDSADEDLSSNKNPPSKMYEDFVKEAYSPALRQSRRTQAELDLNVMEPPRQYETRYIRPKTSKYYDEPDSYYKPTGSTTATGLMAEADKKKVASVMPSGGVRSTLSEPNMLYGNRRYYSRYSDDPDYFDYDLSHSVDLFRKNPTPYVPLKSPRVWEQNLFKDATHMSGDSTISSHMFNKKYEDSRYQNSSYLSAALRTPTYWAYRYQNMNLSSSKR